MWLPWVGTHPIFWLWWFIAFTILDLTLFFTDKSRFVRISGGVNGGLMILMYLLAVYTSGVWVP